ncbi:MAG: NTP transferase domain-containing protein [Phycisphaerales bacterium]
MGGKSRRFGRDKLREPLGNSGMVLVQRPIEVLRAIFGRRVCLVGECDPSIVPLADGVIPDEHPGVGPIGGIASALTFWGGPVFVLAGDMPGFETVDGWNILSVALEHPDCLAVLGATDRVHPCAGYYATAALPVLSDCLARGKYRLTTAVPECAMRSVAVAADSMINVNVPGAISELPVDLCADIDALGHRENPA